MNSGIHLITHNRSLIQRAHSLSHQLKPSRLVSMSTSQPSQPQPKRTFEAQDNLPSLPVPDLQSTATKYFHSILPILSPQQPRSPTASDLHPTPAYTSAKQAVQDFLQSPLVHQLQNRLISRAQNEGRQSWLSEWWNELAYMGYRDALIPFSSYYIAHLPDKRRVDGPSRAASLVRAMMFFRQLILTSVLLNSPSSLKPLI